MKAMMKEPKENRKMLKRVLRTYCALYTVLVVAGSILVIASPKVATMVWKWYPLDVAAITLVIAITHGVVRFFYTKYYYLKALLIYVLSSLVLIPYLWLRWRFGNLPEVTGQNIILCYTLAFMFVSELISVGRKFVLIRRDDIIVTEREIGD